MRPRVAQRGNGLDHLAVGPAVERLHEGDAHGLLLVVDALDLCYTKTHVDTFVIISGDSDFSPLVSKLRENAKFVIGVGVKNSTSDLLIANCDEFIFYDDLVRERKRPAARKQPTKALAAGGAQPPAKKGEAPPEKLYRPFEKLAKKDKPKPAPDKAPEPVELTANYNLPDTIHRNSSKLDRSFEDEICRTRQRDVLKLFVFSLETHFQFVPAAHEHSDRTIDPLDCGKNECARNDASSAGQGFVFAVTVSATIIFISTLSAVLYLKQVEARARGEQISVAPPLLESRDGCGQISGGDRRLAPVGGRERIREHHLRDIVHRHRERPRAGLAGVGVPRRRRL